MQRHLRPFVVTLLACLALARPARAHCDTTKGPVVTAARAALEAGDPNLVLHWVRPEDEASVRSAFQQTMIVRALGPEAKELAERYLFETLVRIHRAGEGAPYTGLTDGDPEPIIDATDKALERGSTEELEQQLVAAVRTGLAERFGAARSARDFRRGDVAGGRAFVAAYVPLTHWVEGVYGAATGSGEHHGATVSHREMEDGVGYDDHPATATAQTHGDGFRHVPWILTGVLALAALVEGAFLARRRRPAAVG